MKNNFHILKQQINPNLHYWLLKMEPDILDFGLCLQKFLTIVSSQQKVEKTRT